MKVLVTGASGLVGSAALAHLLGREYDAVGLVRETSDLRRVKDLGLDPARSLRVASLEDRDRLAVALDGCGVVVHAAARAADWGRRTEFLRDNVQAVANVIEQARALRRLVLISTVNVVGCGLRDMEEDDAGLRVPSLYSTTKVGGEAIARRLCAERGVELVVLRPGAVYGPGDWKWSYRMLERIHKAAWPMIGRGAAVFTPVFVANLNQAVELAVSRPQAAGTYNVTDDAAVSWANLAAWMAEDLGVPLRLRHWPFAPTLALAGAIELLWSAAGCAPPVTRYRVVRIARDFHYSCRLAIERLGYAPDSDIRAHCASTVAWYRGAGGGG